MLRLVRNMTDDGEILSESQERLQQDVWGDNGYKVPSHKLGAKLFSGVSFPFEMTDAEIGKMTRLSKLMVSTSNMLGYRKKGGIVSYTKHDILATVGLQQRRGEEFLRKMQRLGVMAEVVRKIDKYAIEEWYINPAYFFAGRHINVNLYLIFREQLDPILPVWIKQKFLELAQEKQE